MGEIMSKKSSIIFTSENCIIENQLYGNIPLMLDSQNVVVAPVSNWLRYLVLVQRRATSSVRQFAYHLQQWWSFIEKRKITWDSADDYTLMAWRDSFLNNGHDKRTINSRVLTIFRFYLWVEKKGYTNGLIGETDISRGFRPKLSVTAHTNDKGRTRYTTPLLIRTVAKPILPTPTNDAITKVHEALAQMYGDNTDLMIRDSLILLWMEGTGLRRAEVLSLKTSDIPDRDALDSETLEDDHAKINVTGKGGKKRIVFAGRDLLTETQEYIENERQAMVRRFRSKQGEIYPEPHNIFLSAKTGLSLTPDAVSQQLAKAFRKAGIKGSGHRIRARFLTNLVGSLLEAQFEKFKSLPDAASILLPAAQIAGHNNIETLRPYLDIARKRVLLDTDSSRAATAIDKAIVSERRASMAQNEIYNNKQFEKLIKEIKSGRSSVALREFKKLQKIFEKSSVSKF